MIYSEWRIAYAKQAKADLQAREKLLQHSELPDYQQLHFLQMACEKICKAYLCGTGADPQKLQASHAYIAQILPTLARQQLARQQGGGQRNKSWMIDGVRRLARQIELLAPAVKDGGASPANCEYPWIGPAQSVQVPAEYNFQLDLLHAPAGRHLIKTLYAAVDDLIGSSV